MQIYVTSRNGPSAQVTRYPCIILQRDNWNDFGYVTTFSVHFFPSDKEEISVGSVKIIEFGMAEGLVPLLAEYPNGLGESLASLGTNIDYYVALSSLPDNLGGRILDALRDIAVNPPLYERAIKEPTFEKSLVRFSPALAALDTVRSGQLETPPAASSPEALPPIEGRLESTLEDMTLAASATVSSATVASEKLSALQERSTRNSAEERRAAGYKVTFTPASSKKYTLQPPSIVLDFSGPVDLPGRLLTLVGPNGTGKTTLLSQIAQATFFRSAAQNDYGKIESDGGSVGDVLFISYSAFDTFEIPVEEIADNTADGLSKQGYTYVGLRKISAAKKNSVTPHILKSIGEIHQELIDNLECLKSINDDRSARFVKYIRDVFKDPSISNLFALGPRLRSSGVYSAVRKSIPNLSTGHKAIINIVASLCLNLRAGTLVLIDEPEAHLHPPLVAVLLKTVRGLLLDFDAYGVLATHSPVVVQETLGRHVILLERAEGITAWRTSPTETFGENIGALTRQTFKLPAEGSDFVGHLASLVQRKLNRAQIEALFPGGMSSPARAHLFRILAEQASK